MKIRSWAAMGFLATLALGQTAPPPAAPATAAPKPAAPKPAAAKPAATSPVDSVIQSVKAGLSEGLIIKTLQRDNKPMNLTPADLVKLKNAGVSENIIGVMLDPTSAPAPAAAAAPAPAPRLLLLWLRLRWQRRPLRLLPRPVPCRRWFLRFPR